MKIAYLRVSTQDQTVDAQRHALMREAGDIEFDREYVDHGVSGGTMAADRPAFAKLLDQVRKGDEVYFYALDRLGRDAIDVQTTVKRLIDSDVRVSILGIGLLVGDAGKITVAVLSQVAEMERRRIMERTQAGRAAARASLQATGKTHRGKDSLGRPKAADGAAVVAWRKAKSASIAETAAHFGLSVATVKRYGAAA